MSSKSRYKLNYNHSIYNIASFIANVYMLMFIFPNSMPSKIPLPGWNVSMAGLLGSFFLSDLLRHLGEAMLPQPRKSIV